MWQDNEVAKVLNNLSHKVEALDLSIRSRKCLKRANVVYLGDLVQKTESELLGYRNFGRKSLVEIKDKLRYLGLSLEMQIHSWQPKQVQEAPELFIQEPEKIRMFVCPVDSIELSVRTRKCLKRANVVYLGDLVQKTESELLGYRNFGRKSLVEIKDKLRYLGLSLGMRIHSWQPYYLDEASKRLAQELVERKIREIERHHMDLETGEVALEEELMHLTGQAKSRRNMNIIRKYFGWDGGEGMTLQAAGEEFGMTRERVRQICSRTEKALRRKGKTACTPMLDRALEFVVEHMPAEAEQIESQLVEQGFVRTLFRLEGLVSAAEILRRQVSFRLEILEGKRFIVPLEAVDATKLILRLARKAIEHWGATTVSDIAAQVIDKTSRVTKTEFVASVLKILKDFQWLDIEGCWFWIPSIQRNRLVNQIQKILSVAERIDISELRDGTRRNYRMEGFAPPRRVLLELCRQIPWCRVDRTTVISDGSLNWEEILAETEWAMCYVLKEYGPVMSRERLEELCLELGMNRNTFWMYLTYSPILTRYAPGVYGLRGAAIPPGIVESLKYRQKSRQRRGKVLVDYGWTPGGKIWLANIISEGMIRNGVFCIPAAMQQYLGGKFTLKSADGARIGDLRIKGGSGWSLLKLFGRRGGEPGDYLVLLFDYTSHEVSAQIGDADLLYDFQTND